MAYQSHRGEPSASKSHEKLKRLKLPNLSRKSFLDVGCNEGYFCNAAHRAGSRDIVGVDVNRAFVASARKRYRCCRFLQLDWSQLGTLDRTFDCILLASSLHYVDCPRQLMRDIHGLLDRNGVFILECGVVESPRQEWTSAMRARGDVRRFPSLRLLRNDILKPFAVRCVGDSVPQDGDPVPRKVFHCHSLQRTVVVITGATGVGKSVLRNQLSVAGCTAFGSDTLLQTLPQWCTDSTLVRCHHPSNIAKMLLRVVEDGAGHRLGVALGNRVLDVKDDSVLVVDGVVFTDKTVLSGFEQSLVERNARLWVANKVK